MKQCTWNINVNWISRNYEYGKWSYFWDKQYNHFWYWEYSWYQRYENYYKKTEEMIQRFEAVSKFIAQNIILKKTVSGKIFMIFEIKDKNIA